MNAEVIVHAALPLLRCLPPFRDISSDEMDLVGSGDLSTALYSQRDLEVELSRSEKEFQIIVRETHHLYNSLLAFAKGFRLSMLLTVPGCIRQNVYKTRYFFESKTGIKKQHLSVLAIHRVKYIFISRQIAIRCKHLN